MTTSRSTPLTTQPTSTPAERRRVVFATIVGTTVEWYDFFLYAGAAGLVFSHLFFAPAGAQFATVLAFASVGISFLFRPLGAFLAGHFGDRYGRRPVLMAALILMGAATTLIGLLPDFASIGLAAPILLVFLRIVQGLSAGGEWGGAALMAVEHAPEGKRGLYGASPQIGVPLGLLLASGIMGLMAVIAPGDAFLAWGWRIPFLFSVVLILIGYYVRRNVEESPVFAEIAERKKENTSPVVTLFRKHALLVLVAALVVAGNNAVGYMTTGGYVQNYATNPDGPLGMEREPVLFAVALSGLTWLASTWFAGWLSDKINRRNTYLIGWALQLLGVIALFPLVNTGEVALLFVGVASLTIGLGFTYGPQSALYSELFPASVRFSGVSIAYALGCILGGAFAPTIATLLVQSTGTTVSVTIYLSAMTLIGACATLLLRDRTGIPLGPDAEQEQLSSPFKTRAK
ncbi:MFS transporter [Glutamicibacter sp. NPDC087344]|uniref:MFS transporter n=1 Tax=Glutamicibacter sp. NPDC087344 TaxID=3363994 RepID=UPI0037F7BD07